MLSFEEYSDFYYKNKRFPDGAYSNKEKVLNDRQLYSKYQVYCKKIDKQEIKKSQPKKPKPKKKPTKHIQDVQEAFVEAFKLNPNAEEFWSRLTEEETQIVQSNMWGELSKLDPAHIIGQGRCRALSAVVENIIIIPRYVHSALDTLHFNPFTPEHKRIGKEETEALWIKLVGEERWERLNRMYRQGVISEEQN